MTETFGPLYERPAQADCPNCSCCTAPLCARGRNDVHGCSGMSNAEAMSLVSGCPCSAATTHGTHAWRLAQIRAVQHATERPMNTPCALLLRALADTPESEPVDDPDGMLGMLKAYKYAADGEHGPVVTDLGRRYLTACEELRFPAALEVTAVDLGLRTATVTVAAFDAGTPVTVLYDQLAAVKPVDDPSALVGVWFTADANCRVASADEIVLTNVRVADPLPDGFMQGGASGGK